MSSVPDGKKEENQNTDETFNSIKMKLFCGDTHTHTAREKEGETERERERKRERETQREFWL